MKLQRSKNTHRNVIAGLLSRIITIAIPFITQTVFIRTLGNEYNGLKGMFSSILQVLCVAELGFGSAMVFSMYKPIAEEDDDKICALLNLYKKTYRIIGLGILIMGVAIAPFLKYLIKGNKYPEEINIYIVYILFLLNTVVSYLLFAYKSSIPTAFQRQDIISYAGTVCIIITNTLQILVLIKLKSFYFYVISTLIGTILNNLIISFYVDRKYPQYKSVGNVSEEEIAIIKKKVAGLGVSRICFVTRNGFDNIFLSMFLGLEVVGVYNLYYNYIFLNVINLMGIITTAMLAGIGNSVASETIEKNYEDFRKLDYIYMLLSGFCAISMCCLYQPFMKAWVGEKSMFSDNIAILFGIYFYVTCMGAVRSLYSDGVGLWWENRHRVIAEMMCNILLNYVLGKHYGVKGIISATCISLFICGYLGSTFVIFKNYFRHGMTLYLLSHATYAFATIINCFIVMRLCELVYVDNLWLNLFIRLIICAMIIPLIYLIIYSRSKIYVSSKLWFTERITVMRRKES